MFTKRRKAMMAVAIMAPVALLLAGCSAPASPGTSADSIANVKPSQLKGVTISTTDFFGSCAATVGTNTDLSKAVGECPTFQTLVNKFNAENKDGIKVTQRGADWKAFYDSLNASFAAKNPPDVSIMHEANIPDYTSRNLLLPLGNFYKLMGVDSTDFTAVAKDAVTVGNTQYAVPFDEHANLLHLNMTLMAKANLVNPDGSPILPKSPAELVTQAAQFKAATGDQYIAWGNDFNIPFRMFYTFMSQKGVQAFTADGKINLNTPAAKTALNELKDLYSSGIANPKQTYATSEAAWLKGNVGMLVNGTWTVNQYISQTKGVFDYRVANFPTLYSQPGVWANAHTWVIPKQLKNASAVKYRASMEFIAWMYQHDADWALGSGHISVRQSVLNSAAWKNAPQRANYSQTAANASLVPQVVGEQGAEDALERSIEGVWLSGTSVDAALSQAQDAVSTQMKK